MDDFVFKPGVSLGRSQAIDWGGRLTAVDGAAHHDHAARQTGLVVGGHQGNGGQHRHRGLAYRHDVYVGTQQADEVLDVADIVVQGKGARRSRYHTRVQPVGDLAVV